ncbi:hypothetical protein LINPERPRIM_LOCUS27492 [Linum perenne]
MNLFAGHCDEDHVLLAARSSSYMYIVSKWSCLYCNSYSTFYLWRHCHIRGL